MYFTQFFTLRNCEQSSFPYKLRSNSRLISCYNNEKKTVLLRNRAQLERICQLSFMFYKKIIQKIMNFYEHIFDNTVKLA